MVGLQTQDLNNAVALGISLIDGKFVSCPHADDESDCHAGGETDTYFFTF